MTNALGEAGFGPSGRGRQEAIEVGLQSYLYILLGKK